MPSAVINVRPMSDTALPRFIRVTRRNAEDAVAAFDEKVILYAARGHERHGYFASATLVGVHLDLIDTAFMFVEIRDIEMFPAIVPTTDEGEPFEIAAKDREGSLKWWSYSPGLRGLTISERDAIITHSRLALGQEDNVRQAGFLEPQAEAPVDYVRSRRRARKAWLRMEILSKHGPVCALTGASHVSSGGLYSEVDVCHIIPLEHGGSDASTNLLPLSKTIHWGFDLGWVSMLNEGTMIFSPQADAAFRAKFGKLVRARFPKDPAYWPAAESIEYHRDKIFQAV